MTTERWRRRAGQRPRLRTTHAVFRPLRNTDQHSEYVCADSRFDIRNDLVLDELDLWRSPGQRSYSSAPRGN
eukprot:20642-Pleurochrysis_carterae.AAC.1